MDHWQEFIKTGAVSDYLNYKLKEEKRNVEEPNQNKEKNRVYASFRKTGSA